MFSQNLIGDTATVGNVALQRWVPYKPRGNDGEVPSSSSKKKAKEVKRRTKKPVVGMYNPDGSVAKQYHVERVSLFGGVSVGRATHTDKGDRRLRMVLVIDDTNPAFVIIKRIICREESRKSSYPELVNPGVCSISMTQLIREGWHFKVHRGLHTLEGEMITSEFGMMFQMEDEEELFLLADRLAKSGIRVSVKVE